jgi:hypothetical protein
MIPSKPAIAIALWIVSTSATAGDFRLAPFARDPGVERWTWFQILGPRNHPFPIIYLSTRAFMTKPNESLVVLPPERYDIFSAYTHARITRSDCPGTEPRGEIWYTVEVVEHDKNAVRHCMLPQVSACSYLASVVKYPA